MFKSKIKTHKMCNVYTQPHFFILSKGNNSGKPLEKPCPNCFVCICSDEIEKQNFYWLFYSLWQAKLFNPFITGSVIPFIRLDDLKRVAKEALVKIELNPDRYTLNVSVLQQLEKKSDIIAKQIDLIKQTKRALMYEILK